MKAIVFAILALLSVAYCNSIEESRLQFSFHDFNEILRGIFVAWEVDNEEVSELLICVKSLKDIEVQVAKILEELKNITFRDFRKLAEILVRLMADFQIVFKDLQPCLDSEGEIKTILDKFIHLTTNELLKRIYHHLIDNGKTLLSLIVDAVKNLALGKYFLFGYNFGDFIELLFLQAASK